MKAQSAPESPTQAVEAAQSSEAPELQNWPTGERVPVTKSGPLYEYLPALDGLRAISILWVLSVHWSGTMPWSQLGIVKRGPLGVEVFFAISGLLVTRSLHQCVVRAAREGSSSAAVCRDFLVRRVARIWPPYFLALLVAIVGMLVDPVARNNFVIFKPIAWSFPTFLANYTISRHYAPLSLLVMWSLCFEEQFYVVLIALYLIGKKQLTKYIAVAALASIVLRSVYAQFFPQHLSKFILLMEPHWRFDAIAWGCIAWIYRAPLLKLWRGAARYWLLALVVSLVLVLCYFDPETLPGRALWYAALAPAFTALVSALAFSSASVFQRVLSWSPLVFIGSISYEIYLSHITVFRVMARFGGERLAWLYYPLSYACAISVGYVFHRVFSKPAQRIARRWLDRAPNRATALPS